MYARLVQLVLVTYHIWRLIITMHIRFVELIFVLFVLLLIPINIVLLWILVFIYGLVSLSKPVGVSLSVPPDPAAVICMSSSHVEDLAHGGGDCVVDFVLQFPNFLPGDPAL